MKCGMRTISHNAMIRDGHGIEAKKQTSVSVANVLDNVGNFKVYLYHRAHSIAIWLLQALSSLALLLGKILVRKQIQRLTEQISEHRLVSY